MPLSSRYIESTTLLFMFELMYHDAYLELIWVFLYGFFFYLQKFGLILSDPRLMQTNIDWISIFKTLRSYNFYNFEIKLYK